MGMRGDVLYCQMSQFKTGLVYLMQNIFFPFDFDSMHLQVSMRFTYINVIYS